MLSKMNRNERERRKTDVPGERVPTEKGKKTITETLGRLKIAGDDGKRTQVLSVCSQALYPRATTAASIFCHRLTR